MNLKVAIAAEYDDYDAEVFRFLLERLLGMHIERWKTEIRFNGNRSVRKLAPEYLRRAAAEGVRHALFAIDNDGGARRRPEHQADHNQDEEAMRGKEGRDGCRFCWLSAALLPSSVGSGCRQCVVVPVQALETWLLFLRGDPLEPSPEQVYDRSNLKKQFFGLPKPHCDRRTEMAQAQLGTSDALQRLRERPSFHLFEQQLAEWP
jgi:hypothetical protein